MNPSSAGGRTGQLWPAIRARLESGGRLVTLFPTEAPGHGIRLAGEAVRSGFARVVAVGGDGTLNEVVNGILSAGPHVPVEVGLIPRGTGSDFRRTLEIPLGVSEALAVLDAGRVRKVDVMRVAYTQPNGEPASRYAVNVVSFGMGGQVARKANRSNKPLGGRITFLLATVSTALRFAGDRVSIHADDGDLPDVRVTNVAVGNGRYHGAGMLICPRAALDDGLLDLTVVRKLSLAELILNMGRLFDGRVYENRKVSFQRTRGLRAESIGGESEIEVDGEPLGRLPLSIELLPGALTMIVP
jgi:YegS/Rv2252/BmrU family lipid kinase